MRLVAILVAVGSVGCATLLGAHDGTPSSPDAWKAYVKRWAHPSELAVKEHVSRVWQCNEIAVKPIGYAARVDDAGARTPELEWSAAGCGKDAHYFVMCPATSLASAVPAGKVACAVQKKRVVANGLPETANETGSVVIVDDVSAPPSP